MVIPDYPGKRPDIPGVTFVPLPLIPFFHSGDVRFPIVFPWTIRKQIEWADMLWTHTAVSIGGACIRAAKTKGMPIVSMIHSVEWVIYGKASLIGQRFSQWLWLRTARKRYGHANRLLTPGATTKEELLANHFQKDIDVTPLGVSLEQFTVLPAESRKKHRAALGLPTDKPIIGYVGRFGPEKSLRTLIEAHQMIEEATGAHLLLVGGERSDLPAINISKNTTIISPTTEPHRYYQAMDIYVLPSLTESFALGILEAMACGIPVVSTPVGAMPTFIIPDENGVLYPVEDAQSLAQSLSRLLSDESARIKMGQKARQTVEDGYTWKRAADRILERLTQTLEQG